MKEWLQLWYWRIAVKWYNIAEQRRVKKRFYDDAAYGRLDREFMRGVNPYKIKEAFPYGETPLCSLEKIADRCQLKPSDRVIDLGCGRGRGAFFLAHRYGCRVHGIDQVSTFITQAQEIAKRHHVDNVTFTCHDMRDYDYRSFNCAFFYGTCFDERFVEQMAQNLQKLPQGSRIITVSYPIDVFPIQETFSVSFPWGQGDVFIHHKP